MFEFLLKQTFSACFASQKTKSDTDLFPRFIFC